MTLVYTILGLGLNAAILRDIFTTLFNPSGKGALSGSIARYTWRGFRLISQRQPERLSLAGPLSLVMIITLWALGIVLGWAFILWPYLPEHFLLSTGLDPAQNNGFLDAIYVSAVTFGTLGFGEITPQSTWLRMVAPLEALIGFTIFTASISWIMSIYPALSRQRHLARDITLLDRSRQRSNATITDVDTAVLRDFTSQIIGVRNDYVQFPIIYFFRTSDPLSALVLALPTLSAWARAVADHPDAASRLQATTLMTAVEDLMTHLATNPLSMDPEEEVDSILHAYATDHLHHSGQEHD